MTTTPQKTTFGEMREFGVRDVLIYCRNHRCSHSTTLSADQWPDNIRLVRRGARTSSAAACGHAWCGNPAEVSRTTKMGSRLVPHPSGFIKPCLPFEGIPTAFRLALGSLGANARQRVSDMWSPAGRRRPCICSGAQMNSEGCLPSSRWIEKSPFRVNRVALTGRRSFSDFSREPNLPFLLLGLSYMRDLPPERADSPEGGVDGGGVS